MSKEIYCLFARNKRGRVYHKHFKSLEGVLRAILTLTPSFQKEWEINYGSDMACIGHPDIVMVE